MARGNNPKLEKTEQVHMKVKPDFKNILDDMYVKRGFANRTEYIENLVLRDHAAYHEEQARKK